MCFWHLAFSSAILFLFVSGLSCFALWLSALIVSGEAETPEGLSYRASVMAPAVGGERESVTWACGLIVGMAGVAV